MRKLKRLLIKLSPIIISLLFTVIIYLFFYLFLPLELNLDRGKTVTLALFSFVFLNGIIYFFILWDKREILWKMLILTLIFVSIFSFFLLYLLFYFNEPFWLYYYIVLLLLFMFGLCIIFEKTYWFFFKHFSKQIPSCVRENRLKILFVKILIPSISTIPFFFYLLIYEYGKIEFFQGILIIILMVMISHEYTNLLIKQLKEKNWRNITLQIIIPIIVFSSWQVLNVYTNNSLFINYETYTRFEIALTYYSVFMLSIFAYFVLYYIRKGLYSFAKWLYKIEFKS